MINTKAAVKLLAITIGVVGMVLPTTSSAVAYRAREVWFYDDAAHTNLVGYYVSTCIGPIETDYNFTPYFVVTRDEPCMPTPRT